MRQRIYVALDLETTGLNPKRHRIIEVGAVRFQGNHILERFSSLVNPNQPLPPEIQQLTGITDEALASAPSLPAVLPELRAFVDRQVAAIVAHNAPFDESFLKASGLDFHRPSIDTFELATVLLPHRSSYGLEQLCRAEGIPLLDAHRALEDAEATAQLFFHLLGHMRQLPPAVLESIVHYGTSRPQTSLDFFEQHETSVWPLLQLFQEAQDRANRADPAPATASSGSDHGADGNLNKGADRTRTKRWSKPPAAEASIDAILGSGGRLARLMGDAFELRTGQIRMAKAILRALQTSDHLLIEAGTGTGKSLAYLLAAAIWSMESGERVVIATNTLALQDQLLDKELPQLQAILRGEEDGAAGEMELRTQLLKGRTHYLCTRRLKQWAEGHSLSAQEMYTLAKVLVWLPSTQSGDGSSLFLPNQRERAIWAQICSDPLTCVPERCHGASLPHMQTDSPFPLHENVDFYLRARQQSEEAHLLIVNHALLLADLASGERLLPTYKYVIIDEGHRLEEVATHQFTRCIAWETVQNQLQRLAHHSDLSQSIRSLLPGPLSNTIAPLLLTIDQLSQQVLVDMEQFITSLRSLVFAHPEENADLGYAQRLHLDPGVRSQPLWSRIEIDWDHLSNQLEFLLDEGLLVADLLENARWFRHEPQGTYLLEWRGTLQHIQEVRLQLNEIILRENPLAHRVAWLEINSSDQAMTLQDAPIEVGNLLRDAVVHRKKSVIVTGATLDTDGSFHYIKRQLGLDDVIATRIESPFDYGRNLQILMPHDMPSPAQATYQGAVEQAICSAAIASEGRTMALFTNNSQMRKTANAIQEQLSPSGIRVLDQGSSSRRRLLQEYRQTERAVLLGTRTFWEGIDMPGDELITLLIVRLPFEVPDDPLHRARSAQYENPFGEYSVPQAILRLRQGFGRLIRRQSDRGTIVMLDSRLWQRAYGRIFLESLPPCTTKRPLLSGISAEIRTWMNP